MKHDIFIKTGIVIPAQELEVTTSRSGGPGGQHVNTTDTRITVRWNVHTTAALSEEQKARVLEKMQGQLTREGDVVVHNSASRSQQQNREEAYTQLAHKVRMALYIPKKRMKTNAPKSAVEKRLRTKQKRGAIKKTRRTSFDEE